MKNFALPLAIVLSSVSILPAFCQLGGESYHYSSGGARVVNQSMRSYRMPGLTAISPGTISQSARGIQAVGEQQNPGLPKVPWGSTVGTCGDQQYARQFQPEMMYQPQPVSPELANARGRALVVQGRGGRSVVMPQQSYGQAGAPIMMSGPAIPNSPGQQVALHNLALPGVSYGSHFGTAGDMLRSDLHPEAYKSNDYFWHGQPQAPSYAPVRYYATPATGAATYDGPGNGGGY